MTAATTPQPDTRTSAHVEYVNVPMAASTTLYCGTLVALDSTGKLVAATAANDAVVMGVADQTLTSGSSGTTVMRVKRGRFYYVNSGSTDAITQADVGQFAYLVDNVTVARTSSRGLRPPVGRILSVDSIEGVEVDISGALIDAHGNVDVLVPAAADLSAATNVGLLVKFDSAGKAALAGAAGAQCHGVLMSAGAADVIVRVRVAGIAPVKTAATPAIGAAIASDANSKAAAASLGTVSGSNTVGGFVIGFLLETGVADAMKRMLITHSGLIATTAG